LLCSEIKIKTGEIKNEIPFNFFWFFFLSALKLAVVALIINAHIATQAIL